MKKLFIILLFPILFYSCTIGFPADTVIQGNSLFVVYKAEEMNNEYGKYKYAIKDATDYGWTLFSFDKYSIGDTIYLSKNKPNDKYNVGDTICLSKNKPNTIK